MCMYVCVYVCVVCGCVCNVVESVSVCPCVCPSYHCTLPTMFTSCLYHIALSCNDPGAPNNGKRTITTVTVGSEVMFSCNIGYILIGDTVQVCQPDQTWSGTLPRCVCKCLPSTFS